MLSFFLQNCWSSDFGKQLATQRNTTQHNATQHNTTQHNTTQHNTTQKRTLTNRGDNIPLTFSMYFFKSLSRNSKTRYNLPSLWTQSLSSTILSCLSSLSRLISLSAVDGIPSSSTSSRILLRATISLFVLSRAL